MPELSARTGRPPQKRDSSASNSFTFGPEVIQPERSTSATPAMVSSSIEGRVKGRKESPATESQLRATRNTPADDEGDADELLRGERLAEQVPGGDRVDDVAHREHRVGDRHRHPRQSHDPDGDADDVAREPARDVRLEGELHADGQDVLRAELELADRVGAGLEEQLRRGVQQDAGHEQREGDRVHGFLTITRRGSAATIRIGTGCALRGSREVVHVEHGEGLAVRLPGAREGRRVRKEIPRLASDRIGRARP